MIGQTNSVVADDTASVIYAEPLALQTLSANDKGFVRKVHFVASLVHSSDTAEATAAANSYVEPFFVNDSRAVFYAPSNACSTKYSLLNSTWQTGAIGQAVDAVANACYRHLYRGDFLAVNGKHLLLDNSGGFTDVCGNDYYYAGHAFGADFVVSGTNGSIYIYDWENQQVGTMIYENNYNYVRHGIDEANSMIFIQDDDNTSYWFEFTSATTVRYYGMAALPGPVVAYTGLKTGDILAVVSNSNNINHNNYMSVADLDYATGQAGGRATFYMCTGGVNLTAVPNDMVLNRFNIELKTVAHYDNRTHIFSIGTPYDVFFVYWDETTKVGSEIIVSGLSLPTNPDGAYVYNAAFSPNMKYLIVYCGNASLDRRYTKIYALEPAADNRWKVVDSYSKHMPHGAMYSAIATGNTDDDGNVEMKIALPEDVNLTVEVTPQPDLFNFSGDE